jgi:hypothetical protein
MLHENYVCFSPPPPLRIACHPPRFPSGHSLQNIFFVFPHLGHCKIGPSSFRRFCRASPSFTVNMADVQGKILSFGTPLTSSNLLLMLTYGNPNSVLTVTLGSVYICHMLVLLCLLFCMFLLVLCVCVLMDSMVSNPIRVSFRGQSTCFSDASLVLHVCILDSAIQLKVHLWHFPSKVIVSRVPITPGSSVCLSIAWVVTASRHAQYLPR